MATLCQISGFGRIRTSVHSGRWRAIDLYCFPYERPGSNYCLEWHSLAGHRASRESEEEGKIRLSNSLERRSI